MSITPPLPRASQFRPGHGPHGRGGPAGFHVAVAVAVRGVPHAQERGGGQPEEAGGGLDLTGRKGDRDGAADQEGGAGSAAEDRV
jgi:hypothetical protein